MEMVQKLMIMILKDKDIPAEIKAKIMQYRRKL